MMNNEPYAPIKGISEKVYTEFSARNPLDKQVGGEHYRKRAIQPVEYIHANNLGFLEGCVIKRITRWRDKNGFEDLEKIKHEIDLLMELERKKHGGIAPPPRQSA